MTRQIFLKDYYLLSTYWKNIANGYLGLDSNAKAPLAQIPDELTGKNADSVDGYDIVSDKGFVF